MKKSILLLSACLVAGFSYGQEASRSILNNAAPQVNTGGLLRSEKLVRLPSTPLTTGYPGQVGGSAALSGARTTATGPTDRWYHYATDLLQPYQQSVSNDIWYRSHAMWNDSSAKFGYTSPSVTYSHNQMISLGMGLDPFYSPWNNATPTSPFPDFTGFMAVSMYNAYTVDSVRVDGWYSRVFTTTQKTNVVDTMVLTFVEGPSTSPSTSDLPGASTTGTDYGVVTVYYNQMFHDAVNNRAAHNGGTPVTTYTYYIPLTAADSCGTLTNYSLSVYPRVGHSDPVISFPVPAGHIMAMSATFKSGDALYPAFPLQDSVTYVSGGNILNKYNHFEPMVYYACTGTPGGSSSATAWPPYDVSNLASGEFGLVGGGLPGAFSKYYTNWDLIAAGSGGSHLPPSAQYPAISYHLHCPTCDSVGTASLAVKNVVGLGSVFATPNPATDQVIISFGQVTGNTDVTLTDMVGQVVASQTVSNGRAFFNTSALASGIYIYSVTANGQSATGRVVVAH